MPDFYTLSLVIFLTGLSLVIIWSVIACRYRDQLAFRYWLAGSATIALGGMVLATQGNVGLIWQTVTGNALTIGGFYLNLMGIRRFHGGKPLWRLHLTIIAVNIVAMAASFEPWYGWNPLYTIFQAVPLILAILYLKPFLRRDPGAVITSGALAICAAAHLLMAGMLLSCLLGYDAPLPIATAAAIDLLFFLFGAFVWNFGFIIMAVDRLRGEVERLAAEDDLTGLPNRRAFMKCLAKALMKPSASIGLLIFDLDRFKSINDQHGHAAGDAALRHVADTIRGQLGADVFFARLGGDEFAIIAPAAGGEAVQIAQRVIDVIPRTPMLWQDQAITITLSMGISHRMPDQQTSAGELLEQADKASYLTKRRGRNGYSFYSGMAETAATNVVHLSAGNEAGRAHKPKR